MSEMPAFTGRGKRSPLYRYMYENHDALLADITQFGAFWTERTRWLAEQGYTNRKGQPAGVRTVQETWYAVRRDHGKIAHPKTTLPAVDQGFAPVKPRNHGDGL